MKRILNLFKRRTPKVTLRDNIAMSILPVILQDTGQIRYGYGGCKNLLYNDCQTAYLFADVMLEVRGSSYESNKISNKKAK